MGHDLLQNKSRAQSSGVKDQQGQKAQKRVREMGCMDRRAKRYPAPFLSLLHILVLISCQSFFTWETGLEISLKYLDIFLYFEKDFRKQIGKELREMGKDINCDMGESFGRYKLGLDEEVIKLISSANVGCGFHGGDPHVMRQTVDMAKQHGVAVGAHPGLPDLLGFGRREMKVSPEEVKDYFIYQIGALKAFVEVAGMKLQHVKMHGALIAMALANEELALAMCEAVRDISPDLIWVTFSGIRTVEIARSIGLKVIQEFYADRAYHADKTLVSRKLPGAVLKDPEQISARIKQLIDTGTVTTLDGQTLELKYDSICVHGDTPGALDIIRTIRGIMAEHRIAIKPMAELI